VTIVGAELSGLLAARTLHRAGAGVLVVEAQDRVGGRTLHLDESTFIDDGGQWVSPNQDRIVALAAELGVDLFPSWGEAKMVLVREGECRPSDGLVLPEEGDAADEATRAGKNLAPMAEEVPVDAPWTAPKASEWDAKRLPGFIGGHVWRGLDGLRDFLAQRAGFFDEQHVIEELLRRSDEGDEIEAHTRLHFFLRRWEAPSPHSEEFTGRCFHTWRIRAVDGEWRVAAQMVERFEDLNESSKRLFATPESGLNR
jgi:monoamine oxidase